MDVRLCKSCDAVLDDVSSERCTSGPCFRSRLEGIKFGFTGGGSYGKQAFHDMTIRERQDEQLRGAAEAGIKIAPVGSRWV